MNDLFDIAFIVFVGCIAFTVAFFIKWVIFLIKNARVKSTAFSKINRHYIEVFCVLISLVIASVSVILTATPWQGLVSNFVLEDYLYIFVLFFSSFFIVMFFRALAPVFLGIYIVYCSLFLFLFVQSYSTIPQKIILPANNGSPIALQVVTISYKNLLPLPRKWVSEPYAISENTAYNTEITSLFGKKIHNNDETVFSSFVALLESIILEKDVRVQELILSDYVTNENNEETTILVDFENSNVVVTAF